MPRMRLYEPQRRGVFHDGACAVCGAPLPSDAKLDALPEPEVALSRSMRAGLAAPADARRAVGSLPLLEAAREKVGLLVSELVTNSIRHAGLGAGDPSIST